MFNFTLGALLMKIKNLIYLFLFTHLVFSQQPNEYLVNFNKAKTLYQLNKKLDSAFYYAKNSLLFYEKIKNDSLSLKSNELLIFITSKVHQDKNEYYLKQLEERVSQIENKKLLSNVFMNLGKHFYTIQNDNLAMKYRLKANDINTQSDIKNREVVSNLTGIAQILIFSKEISNSRNFDRAEKYVLKAIKIAEEIENDTAKGAAYEKYAHLKSIQENFSLAKKYLSKSLKASKNAKDTLRESSVYLSFAMIQDAEKRKDSAEFYFKKRVEILDNSSLKKELAVAHLNIGYFYIEKNRLDDAIKHLEIAQSMFQQKVDNRNELEIATLKNLAKAYYKTNQSDKAYETLTLANKIKDSTTIANNDAQVLELETKYETEKKEQEIKLLSVENKLEKKQKYIYISITTIVLLFGLFLFFGYRNKIKTAEKINELNKLKSRFFANISHEFRTPLTLIKSPVQSLQNEISNENQLEKLKLIDKNSDRMLELVNQLLELSKIDTGNLKLILKKENLKIALYSIIESFVFQAKEAKISFSHSLPNTNENHFFDKDVIEKIITNLLSNAFKYTTQDERIDFRSVVENNILKIIVTNSGSDLKQEDLPKLFERFYQKNDSKQGTGIGLALVKELVNLYQGKLETKLENKHLSFIVWLPLDKENSNAIKIDNSNEKEQEKITNTAVNTELPILLIVDDNKDIREILKSIFIENYTIIEAENGEIGLTLSQKEIPDCIISDVMMPKMDGFEFTKAIKTNELTSFIPVILLTAKTSVETHLEALKNTADAFLTKPFNNEIVKETVSQQIAERKKLQERYSKELVLKPTEIIVDSYDEKFINKLQTILDKNLSNPDFTAENFATEANLSRMQLHRKLKTLFGVSATEFIRNERIKIAHDLLKNSKTTISEVAYSVGFNEVTYFSKCFKDFYKITPSEFQKLH